MGTGRICQRKPILTFIADGVPLGSVQKQYQYPIGGNAADDRNDTESGLQKKDFQRQQQSAYIIEILITSES
jgi:hypothetical protein